MAFFAVMSIACVLYKDGHEHCDVRTKAIFEAPNHSVCVMEVQRGTFKVASSALAISAVQRISAQESYCYSSTAKLADKEQMLPLFMEATGKTFVLTRY